MLVRGGAQARDHAEDRRALVRAVVENRERQVELVVRLADGEYLLADLAEDPARPLRERLAPERRERLRRAEPLGRAADEQHARHG